MLRSKLKNNFNEKDLLKNGIKEKYFSDINAKSISEIGKLRKTIKPFFRIKV